MLNTSNTATTHETNAQQNFELLDPGKYELSVPNRPRIESISERVLDDETVSRLLGSLSLRTHSDSDLTLADPAFWQQAS